MFASSTRDKIRFECAFEIETKAISNDVTSRTRSAGKKKKNEGE